MNGPEVTHVVLLKPRADLAAPDRQALLDALSHAFSNIPEIRRVRIGRRILLGRGYESQMAESYEFLCVIEFDDRAALKTYLDHPAHAELGNLFYVSAERALVYDYEMVEPERIRELL